VPSTSRTEEIQLRLCFKKKILARLVMDFKESSSPNFAGYVESILENHFVDLMLADKGNVDVHPQPKPIVKPKFDARGRPQLSVKEREQVKAAIVSGMIRPNAPIALLASAEEEL